MNTLPKNSDIVSALAAHGLEFHFLIGNETHIMLAFKEEGQFTEATIFRKTKNSGKKGFIGESMVTLSKRDSSDEAFKTIAKAAFSALN